MEAGRSGPDRPPVLEATWRAVIDAVREPRRKICRRRTVDGRADRVAGGGAGRRRRCAGAVRVPAASAGEAGAAARVEHLPKLKLPTLFVSGTSDAFGSPEEIKAAAKKVKGSKAHFLDGADHGFAVKKSTGRTKDDVFAEAVDVFADWLLGLK